MPPVGSTDAVLEMATALAKRIWKSITRLERRLCFATPVASQYDLQTHLEKHPGFEAIDCRDTTSEWTCTFRVATGNEMECFESLLKSLRTDTELVLPDDLVEAGEGFILFRRNAASRRLQLMRAGHHWSSPWKNATLEEAACAATDAWQHLSRIGSREHGGYRVRKALISF